MTSTIGVKKIQYPNGTDILTLDSSGSLAIGAAATVGGTLGVTGASTLSGDLTVDTTTLKVDASNNKVGIGTASPEETLEVVHATAPAIQLNRTNDGGFKSILRQQGNDFEIRGSSGSTKIYTGNADGDNSTARMIINASGQVTKPNQPAFAAYRNAGDVQSVTTFIYNVAVYNIGSHYNTSNGRFTAPVAGRYQFNCMMSHNGAGTASIGFFRPQINGVSQSWMFPIGPNIDHYSIGMSFTLNLAVNDYVSISTGTAANILGSGNIHNHFSGYFVG